MWLKKKKTTVKKRLNGKKTKVITYTYRYSREHLIHVRVACHQVGPCRLAINHKYME